ncbi:hypothetical protein Syun_023255 [Stephania yunnanensis]|uniref:Uncharacterized protein n=1 Tax=Stephania yunnanensis TaxID=152371 RepID=A0AAP0FNF6_9MAGN
MQTNSSETPSTVNELYLHLHTVNHDGMTFIDTRSEQFYAPEETSGADPRLHRTNRWMMKRCTSMWRMPEMVLRAEFDIIVDQLRKVMAFMHQQFGMTMDGAGLSQPQPPPPPPPHDQQLPPQIDPPDPPQQGDHVERETQEWLTRDEQLVVRMTFRLTLLFVTADVTFACLRYARFAVEMFVKPWIAFNTSSKGGLFFQGSSSIPDISDMSVIIKSTKNRWLQELALFVALKCLSFDYVGTSLDESSEEFGTVQVPSARRLVLEDMNLRPFYNAPREFNCYVVDGRLSHTCYLMALATCYRRLCAKSVDEDAKEKLAPYSALSGDESYSNRDLEKVGSVYAPFFLFIAICAVLRPLFTGYRVSKDVPASRKMLVQ